MKELLDLSSLESYRRFLKIKSLPTYSFAGREASYPDEYSSTVEGTKRAAIACNWEPSSFLYDYQKDITRWMIRKEKAAAFIEPGRGKTPILIECANAAREALPPCKRVLIVAPLMVVPQIIAENQRFYGASGHPIQQVRSSQLGEWMYGQGGIGITNYDALTDAVDQGNVGAILLDESSMLKSMYGKWGQRCIKLGRGLRFKYCFTGTPAPNDRIEYANHAVFLDHFPTQNAFLARFFVNRGQTDSRWELRPHAIEPFYRALSHWAFFMTAPASYGWKDGDGDIPPIRVHIEHVELTTEQSSAVRAETGMMFAATTGGIATRSTMAQIAKGKHNGRAVETRKYDYIREIVDREPRRGTIVWARYNQEQDRLAETFPDAANISGDTPLEERLALIEQFKASTKRQLISKPKILGFGLNLQVATRQIFSSLQDSYEEYVQAIKRSNRIGSVDPLDVYIPATEIEMPMIETVIRKAKMVDQDTMEQERIFKKHAIIDIG